MGDPTNTLHKTFQSILGIAQEKILRTLSAEGPHMVSWLADLYLLTKGE